MIEQHKMEDAQDRWVGLTRHMASIISDFSEFLALKNEAGGDALVASIATALVEMSFKHSNVGKEAEAIEHTIEAMRLMHKELADGDAAEEQKEAMEEAKEAKARGRVQ